MIEDVFNHYPCYKSTQSFLKQYLILFFTHFLFYGDEHYYCSQCIYNNKKVSNTTKNLLFPVVFKIRMQIKLTLHACMHAY